MYSDYDYDEVMDLLFKKGGFIYPAVIFGIGLAIFLWFVRAERNKFRGPTKRWSLRLIPAATGLLNGISLSLSQVRRLGAGTPPRPMSCPTLFDGTEACIHAPSA